jgi:hypothetical protein
VAHPRSKHAGVESREGQSRNFLTEALLTALSLHHPGLLFGAVYFGFLLALETVKKLSNNIKSREVTMAKSLKTVAARSVSRIKTSFEVIRATVWAIGAESTARHPHWWVAHPQTLSGPFMREASPAHGWGARSPYHPYPSTFRAGIQKRYCGVICIKDNYAGTPETKG